MAQKLEPSAFDRPPIGVLLVGFGTLRPGTLDELRARNLSPVEHVPTRDEALVVLHREGYRYGLLLLADDLEPASKADMSGADQFLSRVDGEFPWILSWRLLADTSDLVADALNAANSVNPGARPPAPYSAARTMQPLREAGPLLFSLALTNVPWLLEADAIVVPVGPRGELGTLGLEMSRSINTSPPLERMASVASGVEGFSELVPVRSDLDMPSAAPEPRTVIFATEGATADTSPSADRAVRACLEAIRMATEIDSIRTLVLPLVGTGASLLEPGQVLRRLLADFDPRMPLGTLAHVIVVTPDEGLYDELAHIGSSDSLVLAQQLENDLPRGDDKLNVKNDIDALADSMAMRDMMPPLVVGILGGWGTGKSFALHLLKERLRKIRCWDLTKPRVHETFPFVGHIYLVHFDAWTYAKSDLWASLMHKILADLNRQLALEEAGRNLPTGGVDVLKRGLDIWSLLENLRSPELAALETAIGARALESLRSFEPGVKVAQSLRRALEREREQERESLHETRRALTNVRREFERKRKELTGQIEGMVASAESAADEAVAEKTKELRGEAEAARARLEAREEQIRNEDAAAVEKDAREAAWKLSLERLQKAFYDGVVKDLPVAVETPAAVASLVEEGWRWKRWLSTLTPQHVVYLLAALAGVPLVYRLIESFAGSEVWSTLGAAAAALTGAATSVRASAQKAREKLATEQAAFDVDLEHRRAELSKRKAAETATRIAMATEELRKNAERLSAELAAQQAAARKLAEQQHADALESLRADRDQLDKKAAEDIEQLEARAEEQERLVGITLEAPSLYEVIKERVDADNYDEHLGIVHRVQEDLKQISEALMPDDRHDIETFPRGEPRIVLIIDDLDRCPPKEVVQVLEAAQLLVKTRLFVVVIGMDVRYVSRSLEEFYKGVLIPDGTPSGLDYIEKIVQIPYRVPDIAPSAMRPFLERQVKLAVDVEVEVAPAETERPEDGGVGGQEAGGATEPTGPVFGSSVTAEDYEELLPETVQVFSSEELDVLHECCTAAEVSPRSAKRLVNVFKLMKIIWFHRGPDHEPDNDIKKGMLILMTLSARQPVIMREILRDLDGLLRRGLEIKTPLSQLLRERLALYRNDGNTKTIDYLIAVVAPEKPPSFVPDDVTLTLIGAENLRLVRSFSFVGETVDEIDASPSDDPDPRAESSAFEGTAAVVARTASGAGTGTAAGKARSKEAASGARKKPAKRKLSRKTTPD